MIKFELDGKPFNPKTFSEKLMKAAMESVAEQIREKVSSIRHPQTGEFPTIVVFGTSLEDIHLRVEGSPELVALVHERLGITSTDDAADSETIPEQAAPVAPKVFLSYAWEDKELASRIAHALQANGIETWWDEWCMSAGDSLRQKIDEGLGECTHFVVLLTPVSMTKPWVKQEMDAGLMLKLQSQLKFIPLRYQLSAPQLPPLLQGMVSPAIEDPDQKIDQLIRDIHGVTKKPPLGPVPGVVAEKRTVPSSKYSAAATAIAKVFVQRTEFARKFDPWIEQDELIAETGLSREDVIDAAHELSGMLVSDSDSYYPESELFATFDQFWQPWNPSEDGLKLAADMLNDADFPEYPGKIAEMYRWNARRLNPAMAYLINRKIIQEYSCLCTDDWLVYSINSTDNTRRFVKSRQL